MSDSRGEMNEQCRCQFHIDIRKMCMKLSLSQEDSLHYQSDLGSLRKEYSALHSNLAQTEEDLSGLRLDYYEVVTQRNEFYARMKNAEASQAAMREALKSWMESYRIMADKTDGILRDSIRGFFMGCPAQTKPILDGDGGKRALAVIESCRGLKKELEEVGCGCMKSPFEIVKALKEWES